MTYFRKKDSFDVLWNEMERLESSVKENIEECRDAHKISEKSINRAYKKLANSVEDLRDFIDRFMPSHYTDFAYIHAVREILGKEIIEGKSHVDLSSPEKRHHMERPVKFNPPTSKRSQMPDLD